MAIFRYRGKRLSQAYKREPIRGIREWAESEVVFTDLEVSPILGNFKVKYSPHYVKLFALIDRTLTRELFAKWASQSGKSLFGVLVAAHKLDTMPSTVIYSQPLKDDVSVILQTKINPVLKSIPKLWKKFEDYKESEKVRTKDAAKKLAGGNFLVKGSGVKDRKSQTSPFIVLDEIGEFEEGAVFEFKERTKSFTKFHPKVIGVSTIVHQRDEICSNFDACSVKIEWHYVCLKCKQNFYPDIKQFKYKSKEDYLKENNIADEDIVLNKYIDEAKATVHMECPHCEHKINTKEKDVMIAQGSMDWYIKHENETYELLEIENLTTETSFGADMNSFGSFFVTYEDMVENIIKAGDDEVKLDKLYRGWFNRFYKKDIKEVEQNDMFLLGNGLNEWEIPKDTMKIFVTVDNQKDHFWVQVTAYTYSFKPQEAGYNLHIVFFGRIEGWDDLEDIWKKCQHLEDENGGIYRASELSIDRRGYNEEGMTRSKDADDWVKKMTRLYGKDIFYTSLGLDKEIQGKSMTVTTKKDLSEKRAVTDTKIIKFQNYPYKREMFTMMNNTIQYKKAEEQDDEGYRNTVNMMFINQENIERDMRGVTDKSITRMLTAEVLGFAKNKNNGRAAAEESYIPIRKRNDALDTTVMSLTLADKNFLAIERRPSNENLEAVMESMASLDMG